MNIKLVKLSTGEEIICEYKEENDKVVLENPIMMEVVPTEQGVSVGMTFPWMMVSGKEIFELQKIHIICAIDPVEELANQYNSQFGSGIVTARDIPDIPNIIL